MQRIAFLFPGQGSQKVGMGRDFYDTDPAAREIFAAAEAISGLPVCRLCFDGPMAELTETVHLQPCVTAVNLAILGAVTAAGIRPAVCAGHSLGEFSALFAAGVISLDDTLRLVVRRGNLMHRDAQKRKGAMVAVIGLDIEAVRAITAEADPDGGVTVANHNSREQIIVTGEADAVAVAATLAKERGARAIPLKVSGAWHSRLMAEAQTDFVAVLEETPFHEATTPVVLNVTATPETDGNAIRETMRRQLGSPVRWYDTMTRMMADGIDTFVEIGPGNVLGNLLRKNILPKNATAKVININNIEHLMDFIAQAGT